jgi:DNA polymerase III epsilon subunit-like protein
MGLFNKLLEFAALQVDPSGTVTAEFSKLVRVTRPVPDTITKLTGIAQADVHRERGSRSLKR